MIQRRNKKMKATKKIPTNIREPEFWRYLADGFERNAEKIGTRDLENSFRCGICHAIMDISQSNLDYCFLYYNRFILKGAKKYSYTGRYLWSRNKAGHEIRARLCRKIAKMIETGTKFVFQVKQRNEIQPYNPRLLQKSL